MTPLLVTRNFCINPGFVEHWFKAPVTQMGCPKAEIRRALSEPSLLTRGVTCGFVFQEGIAAYSRTVAGARRVYRMGLWLTGITVLLGLVLAVQTILAIASGDYQGDIVNDDTDRTMNVSILHAKVAGVITDAYISLEGSQWTATGDSTVCLVGDVKETHIDAASGITVQAVAGEGCGLKGEYTLASGGKLVVA